MTLEISDYIPANELPALNRKFEFSHALKNSFHSDLTSPLSRQKNNKTGRFKPLDCVVKECCSSFFKIRDMRTTAVYGRLDWCKFRELYSVNLKALQLCSHHGTFVMGYLRPMVITLLVHSATRSKSLPGILVSPTPCLRVSPAFGERPKKCYLSRGLNSLHEEETSKQIKRIFKQVT